MRHRRATMYCSGALLLATIYMFYAIPKGFLPQEDADQMLMFTRAAQGISYDAMVEHQQPLASDHQARSERHRVTSPASAHRAVRRRQQLGHPVRAPEAASQRKLSVDQLIVEWRPKLNSRARPDRLSAESAADPDRRAIHRSMYQLTLQSQNTATLYKYAPMLEIEAARCCRTCATSTATCRSRIRRSTSRSIATRRTRSASRPRRSKTHSYDAYGSRQISTIYAPNNEYWVIMEVEPQYQADPGTLSLLYVRSSSGALVPLDTRRASSRGSLGPLCRSTIPDSCRRSRSPSTSRPASRSARRSTRCTSSPATPLPASITTDFQGTAQAFESSLRELGILLVMAILVIYLVLGVLYESFIHPITILSGLPRPASARCSR